jgi:ribosomal protein S18 acetylase RimI-like enzyme
MLRHMWRLARPEDDEAIVAMCLALDKEDPASVQVPEEHPRRTLERLRAEPIRGRALILEVDEEIIGYAFLISFWSNELGGDICNLDEIFVAPAHRSRGYATSLVRDLQRGSALWHGRVVAVQLEVSPRNSRARALYTRLGFETIRNVTMRSSVER